MKRKMPKAVKEAKEAMAKEHVHSIIHCSDCRQMVSQELAAYPPILKTEVRNVIVYKRFNLYAVLALIVVLTGVMVMVSWVSIANIEKNLLVIANSNYEEAKFKNPKSFLVDCTQFVPEEGDWKSKCQRAYKVLLNDPRAGREAFRILDE